MIFKIFSVRSKKLKIVSYIPMVNAKYNKGMGFFHQPFYLFKLREFCHF